MVDLDRHLLLLLSLGAHAFPGKEAVLTCAFIQVEGDALDISRQYVFELLCHLLLDLPGQRILLRLIELTGMPIEFKLHNRSLYLLSVDLPEVRRPYGQN